MPKISIAEARDAIRSARRVEFLGYRPTWRWRIKNTSGDGWHELVYEEGREDVVCLSCEAKYGQNRCWARKRILKWMEDHAKTGTLPKPKLEESEAS